MRGGILLLVVSTAAIVGGCALPDYDDLFGAGSIPQATSSASSSATASSSAASSSSSSSSGTGGAGGAGASSSASSSAGGTGGSACEPTPDPCAGTCGTTADDGCGVAVTCSCSGGAKCVTGDAGTAGTCCVPKTCAEMGSCLTGFQDGCGGFVTCDDCGGWQGCATPQHQCACTSTANYATGTTNICDATGNTPSFCDDSKTGAIPPGCTKTAVQLGIKFSGNPPKMAWVYCCDFALP